MRNLKGQENRVTRGKVDQTRFLKVIETWEENFVGMGERV